MKKAPLLCRERGCKQELVGTIYRVFVGTVSMSHTVRSAIRMTSSIILSIMNMSGSLIS